MKEDVLVLQQNPIGRIKSVSPDKAWIAVAAYGISEEVPVEPDKKGFPILSQIGEGGLVEVQVVEHPFGGTTTKRHLVITSILGEYYPPVRPSPEGDPAA
ncbi:MAG: hypothetical protein Q7S63_01290 [bacterium]|nr:hypothetical protein [bacterium]